MPEEEREGLSAEGVPIALPPEQEAAFQEAVAQAMAGEEEPVAEEPVAEEEEVEEEAPTAPARPIILPQLVAAGGRTGAAARALMEQIGQRLPDAGPPGDDLSDLFEGPDMEKDNDVYIKDLVTVEEEDVFGEGGEDMSDILEVTEEDVMGEEDPLGSEEVRGPVARRPTFRRTSRPAGMRGLQM